DAVSTSFLRRVTDSLKADCRVIPAREDPSQKKIPLHRLRVADLLALLCRGEYRLRGDQSPRDHRTPEDRSQHSDVEALTSINR
ncbi:hypothetical protein Q0N25_14055, partial [Staphylococcus aureus]|nr:hypothetical protein [Staphylococcus aureus]